MIFVVRAARPEQRHYNLDVDRDIPKSEYESVVVDTLRRHLIDRDFGIRYDGKIVVEEVRVDTSRSEHTLEVLFRDDAHPECLFGWRFPATSADALGAPGTDVRWGREQAVAHAEAMALSHFVEQIEAEGYGLPADCDTAGVTWIGGYRA